VQSNVVYTPGQLLFVRGTSLMSQAFDARKVQTTGDPVAVASEVGSNAGGIRGQGLFSASQNGVLAYAPAGATEVPQLQWFDRTGKLLGGVAAPDAVLWAAISPDGNMVAEDHPDPQSGNYDVWLHDLKRGTASRFTFNSNLNRYPVWSPDGSHVAFSSATGPVGDIYQKAAGGNGQEEVLDKDARNKRPDDWSRDGRYLIEEVLDDPKTGNDIWVLPLLGDRKPFPYLRSSFNEHNAKLSPDGHWLAYVSNETKRDEVYVQSFPTPGGKWQISANGGGSPVWSKDGKELFFIGEGNKLMVAQVKESAAAGDQNFAAGIPQPLFDTQFLGSITATFDVSKDGKFLIPAYPEETGNTTITVVVNWTAGLKK
jgi:dipeptidyl aminopeptidase/acylaminoacyl peptidase